MGLVSWSRPLSSLSAPLVFFKKIYPDQSAGHVITLTATLAQTHQTLGHVEEATAYLMEAKRHLEALEVREKHPVRISTMNNLALVYMRRGEPEKAVGLLEECLELVEDVLGEKHVRMATTGHNLGACYVMLKRYQEAYPLYQMAWKEQVTRAGAGNEWSLIFLRDLTQCAGFLNQRADEIRYLDTMIEETHKNFGDNHYLMKWAINQYRQVWRDEPAKWQELRQRLSGEESWPSRQLKVLVKKGARWHYHTGSAPPEQWAQMGFDLETWPAGLAPLGYGEEHIATEIPMGSDPKQKWASGYFVVRFTHDVNQNFSKVRVRVRHDDGVALFLNGREVLRRHLPDSEGTTWRTYATSEVGGLAEELYYVTDLDPKMLREVNTLAAQVHQCNGNSSDLSFDLTLEGLVSGPYHAE